MKRIEALRKIDGLEHRFSVLQKECKELRKILDPGKVKKKKTK